MSRISTLTALLSLCFCFSASLDAASTGDEPVIKGIVCVSSESDTFFEGYYEEETKWIFTEGGVPIAIFGVPDRGTIIDLLKDYLNEKASTYNLKSIRYLLSIHYRDSKRDIPFIYIPRQRMRGGIIQLVIEAPRTAGASSSSHPPRVPSQSSAPYDKVKTEAGGYIIYPIRRASQIPGYVPPPKPDLSSKSKKKKKKK